MNYTLLEKTPVADKHAIRNKINNLEENPIGIYKKMQSDIRKTYWGDSKARKKQGYKRLPAIGGESSISIYDEHVPRKPIKQTLQFPAIASPMDEPIYPFAASSGPPIPRNLT